MAENELFDDLPRERFPLITIISLITFTNLNIFAPVFLY
jgi:hypothetical protein